MSDAPNVDALLERVSRLTQRIQALTTASDVATTSAVDLLAEARATPTPDRGAAASTAARRVVWTERARRDTDARATLWPSPTPRSPVSAAGRFDNDRWRGGGAGSSATGSSRPRAPASPPSARSPRRPPPPALRQLARARVNSDGAETDADALACFDLAAERAAAEDHARAARLSPLTRALTTPHRVALTPQSPNSPGARGTPLSPRSATARAVLASLSPPSADRRRSGSADSPVAAGAAVLSPRAQATPHVVRSVSPLHEWGAPAATPASPPSPSSPSREPASTPGSLSASPPGRAWSPGDASAGWLSPPPAVVGQHRVASPPHPPPVTSPGGATWSPASRAGSFSASADDEASAGEDEPSPPLVTRPPACVPARMLPSGPATAPQLSLECDEDGSLDAVALSLPPAAPPPPPVYLSPRRTTDEGAELMDSDDYADPTPPASPKLPHAPVVSLTASAASPPVLGGTLSPATAHAYALAVLTASAGGLPRPPPPPGASADAADAVADAAAEALALEADAPRAASGALAGARLRDAAAARVAGWVAHVATHGDASIATALAQDAHDDAVAWRLRDGEAV